MKLKVSNVCQLLDKSKYPATITNSGVTFTNNGDGTITLNGTNTGDSTNLYSFMYISVKAGHYYYIYSGQEGRWENCMFTVNYSISAINGDGNIGFQDRSFDTCVVYLYIGAGATFNNYIVKPQFFDLTEMYGAGHEPTTVEQFRQDFPNEMYDYSPECWKRLKELRYKTETKNLLDISKAEITQHNGYWTSNANYTEHFYTQIVEPGKTYTVSYECYNPLAGLDALSLGVQTGSGFGDGTALYIGLVGDAKYKWDKQYRVFTIPNDITQITLSAFTDTMFRNLQIELGSTATPYQPYGYFPLRRGKFRTETKNLLQLNDFSNSWLTIKGNAIRIKKTNDVQVYDDQAGFSPISSQLKAGKYYRISAKVIGEFTGRLYRMFGDSLYSNEITDGRWQKTFTTDTVTDKYGLYIAQNNTTSIGMTLISDEVVIYDIMLEESDTAFTGTAQYQPYKHVSFH